MTAQLIELTAAAAAEKVRAGELSARELFEAYRERAAADELNAFTWIDCTAYFMTLPSGSVPSTTVPPQASTSEVTTSALVSASTLTIP